MKYTTLTAASLIIVSSWFFASMPALAQGYGSPLVFQGLSNTSLHSAAARAGAGIGISIKNDPSLMFSHPATMTSIEGLQVSFGGVNQLTDRRQEFRFGGLQNYSAFGPLVLSMTGEISDPDTALLLPLVRTKKATQADSVQRPLAGDNLQPDWKRSISKYFPLEAFAAMPVTIGDMKITVGIGAAEYANLTWFYKNNNCFSPSVLSVLDGTISTSTFPTSDATASATLKPYTTQWYQYYQRRDGAIYGYGGTISAEVAKNLSIGLSGMLLTGSTDDKEVVFGRGQMQFYNGSMRLTKQGSTNSTKTSTSDYSGQDFTVSIKYTTSRFDIGLSIKPPATITRKYSGTMAVDSVVTKMYERRTDSLHITASAAINGTDKMIIPWQGTFGFSVNVRENLTVGIEYQLRPFESAQYTDAGGETSNPWRPASIFRLGAEYRPLPWLALRGGTTNYSEVFEPLSNPIRGEAVSYSIYSAGIGIQFAGATLNLAYEYSFREFVDAWSNAASINTLATNTLAANLSYLIPWSSL